MFESMDACLLWNKKDWLGSKTTCSQRPEETGAIQEMSRKTYYNRVGVCVCVCTHARTWAHVHTRGRRRKVENQDAKQRRDEEWLPQQQGRVRELRLDLGCSQVWQETGAPQDRDRKLRRHASGLQLRHEPEWAFFHLLVHWLSYVYMPTFLIRDFNIWL